MLYILEEVMNALEKKFLSKIDQHLPVLVIFLVSVIACLLRYTLRHILTRDAIAFLLPWFEEISQKGLYTQASECDYNLLYQFLIWVMTRFPLEPLHLYKILSCIGDYLLAGFAALLVYQLDSKNRLWNSIAVYAAILLNPVCFLNSAAWAQCDALFTSFAILGLYFLEKERYNWSLISLGISFSFKLQAVFFMPIYLFVYFTRRKFSIVRFSLIPAAMVATSIPLLFWGRNILETFYVYLRQSGAYTHMALNYPTFWTLVCSMMEPQHYFYLKKAAIMLTVCILAFFMILWLRKKYAAKGRNMLIMTFILIYTCVLFLPSMHERYGYPYEICAILLAVLIPKTVPLCLGLLLVSLCTYGTYIFEIPINYTVLAIANIALYVAYYYTLKTELQESAQS